MEVHIVLILCSFVELTDSICTFPKSLWYKEWYISEDNVAKPPHITFENSTVKNLKIPWTEHTSYICHVKYDSVYVLRSSSSQQSDISVCVQISHMTKDLFFFTLLTGEERYIKEHSQYENISRNAIKERTCKYCNYTSKPSGFFVKHVGANITYEMKPTLFCDPCRMNCHPSSPETKKEKKKPQTFIVGIVIGIFCIGGFLIGLCLYVKEQKKLKRDAELPEEKELKPVESDLAGPSEDFKDIPTIDICEEPANL